MIKPKITKTEMKKLAKKEDKKKLKDWANSVKDRDCYKCAICGLTSGENYIRKDGKESKIRLEAHHLFPREIKEFRYDIDNGITLCTRHHKFSREISAHKNPLAFILWLQLNKSEQYSRLVEKYIKIFPTPKSL